VQSADYEKLVEAYLLIDRAVLLAPQYQIRANRHNRYPDILAVHFKRKIFYLVEVTTTSKPATLAAKCIDYRLGASEIVKGLAKEFAIDPEGWTTKPWVFLYADVRVQFEQALAEFNCCFTTFENAIVKPPAGSSSLDAKVWGPWDRVTSTPSPEASDASPPSSVVET
jgi:hypothetical protein